MGRSRSRGAAIGQDVITGDFRVPCHIEYFRMDLDAPRHSVDTMNELLALSSNGHTPPGSFVTGVTRRCNFSLVQVQPSNRLIYGPQRQL